MASFDETLMSNRVMRDLMNNVFSGSGRVLAGDWIPMEDLPSQQSLRKIDQLAELAEFEAMKRGGMGVPLPQPYQPRSDAVAAARSEGAQAERARIIAKLEALKPTETQYTRIQWRWEEKGARAMYEKIMKALFGPDKANDGR